MADLALYRKYRSAHFDDVIGQDHVVKTITTAIKNGRLSHAYLFTGPRGVGKTSVARLLARALNCTDQQSRPCNECANCKASLNASLDIIEIDAASNRSIDSVRELRDKINLAPAIGSYKVYIIDEVHMLTSEAFNALLKTLEEPPAHAVFILATTEAHKVPETIISRTQRFNFKPITPADIIKHLEMIAKSEKIAIEPAGLEVIAGVARGSFRDAISILDQMSSSGEQPITASGVRLLLGLSDSEAVATVSRAMAAGDAKAAVEALTTVLAGGAQPGQIAAQLASQWREALLVTVGAATATDDTTRDLAAQLSPSAIGTIIEELLAVTRSHWPRESLEVAVIRLAAPAAEPPRPAAPARAQATTAAGATTAPAATAPTPAAPTSEPSADVELWPKVLVMLKTKNNSLCALLQMYPVEFKDGKIVIKSRFNFHRDLFLKVQNRSVIEDAVQKVYGRPIPVTAITDEAAAGRPAKKLADPSAELISSALEILGGEVVEE